MNVEEQKEPQPAPARMKWSLGVGSILPVVALFLSIFSFYTSEKAQRDVARVDVIKTEYGLFHDLAQLQLEYPMMEHLLASSGEAYDSTVAGVKAASASVPEVERAKLRLQERAVAHYIFTTYEETFYLWQQSVGTDERRAELAKNDLFYFNDAICNNPRLLWYWDSKDGGKLSREFADDLKNYYKENVLKDCPIDKDPTGPFGQKESK